MQGNEEITQEELAAIQGEQAKRDAASTEIYEPQHRGGARDDRLAPAAERVQDPVKERCTGEFPKAAGEDGAVQTESGLVINESVVGQGAQPTSLDSVEVPMRAS